MIVVLKALSENKLVASTDAQYSQAKTPPHVELALNKTNDKKLT